MSTLDFSELLKECTEGFTPVIDTEFKQKDYVQIDFSDANKELNEMQTPSAGEFKKYIDGYLKKKKAKVAFGGYNETRNLYKRSVIFEGENKNSPRNIHIGLDLWCDAGTAVLAPIDGTVHSFQDNEGFGNYGPTIILEHNFGDKTFYTLYGHLSRPSLKKLAFGQIIEAGEKIATLGSNKVNGDYAPHLHFQIIEDLQGNSGDFPGVVCKEDREAYLANCPDPDLLLKIS